MKDYNFKIVTKDLSQFPKVYVVPIADMHIGCRDVDLEKIRGYIDWIKQRDNAFTILNGDLMNCAWKESTPDLFEDLTTPDNAYEQLRAMLMPIKGKILMIVRGGHEESIFRKVGCDYMARLAYDLGEIPYKPNGGMVGIRLSRNKHYAVFWLYAVHGWGGARTIGAKVKKVEELAWAIDADVYILSHDHTQNVHRINMLRPPASRISMTRPIYLREGRKLLVNTGGFVTYAGYVQRKGYMPQDLGTPRIRLEVKQSKAEDYHKDVHASV